jgi:hypothetical protein
MSRSIQAADDSWERCQAKWQQECQPIEASIAKEGRRDLDVLERAGAPRDSLVRLLATVASGNDDCGLKDLMRAKQAQLRNNARRMEKLAADAERQGKDPFSQLASWVHLCGGGVMGVDFPATLEQSDPFVGFLVNALRAWAKVNRQNAAAFGTYLRKFARTDSGIVLLLVSVCVWTGQGRKGCHFTELARLLQDAFDASGKRKTFSAESLRKTFDRSVPRMLRLWEKYRQPPAHLARPTTLPGIQVPPARCAANAATPNTATANSNQLYNQLFPTYE